MKQRNNKRRKLTALLLTASLLPVLARGKEIFAPALEQAALFSAAVAMPEASLSLLRERFSGDLQVEALPPVSSSQPEPPPEPDPPAEEEAPSASAEPPPVIEEQYRGTIVRESMRGREGRDFVPLRAGWVRNYTTLTPEEIRAVLREPLKLSFPPGDGPQVLIYHTHATESYEPYDSPYYDIRSGWRSTDNGNNMVTVGRELARVLEEAGIRVLHDETQHDYPSYNGAYDRSAETIRAYQKQYPGLQVMLDLHRDGLEREGHEIIKTHAEIEGEPAAQVMAISGCDNGRLSMPGWRNNLRFAAALTEAVEEDWPGLTRPVFFCHRKYNMDLSPGLLLLEFGSQANTLEEAVRTASLVGESLAKLLLEQGA